MFSKLAFLAIPAFMAIFVAALPCDTGSIHNSCNGGEVQCCNTYQPAISNLLQDKAKELGLLNVIAPLPGPFGLSCTPISAIALGSQGCSSQPVCCTGNNFSNGAIVAGCNSANVNTL